MEALKEVGCTLEDIYALPDRERAELIDGQIYFMATPSTKHQRLVRRFTYEIERYIQQNDGECEVFPAPFAVFLNDDDINYVEPDISVICDEHKLDNAGCHGAPDWVIEIVSPSSHKMDYYLKLFKYRTAGVKEYWIVDPDKERIFVYRFEQDTMDEYLFGNDVPVGIYRDFVIKVE